jgi:malonyl-CoA/methylmalonyl-CoA synthetase
MMIHPRDSGASHVIAHPNLDTDKFPIPTIDAFHAVASDDDDDDNAHLLSYDLTDMMHQNQDDNNDAMLIYTSGTTGLPKGVLTTHKSLYAQVHDLITAWEFNEKDHVLHFLPLHHIHGLVNNLLAPLCAGATVHCLHSSSPVDILQQYEKNSHIIRVECIYPLS